MDGFMIGLVLYRLESDDIQRVAPGRYLPPRAPIERRFPLLHLAVVQWSTEVQSVTGTRAVWRPVDIGHIFLLPGFGAGGQPRALLFDASGPGGPIHGRRDQQLAARPCCERQTGVGRPRATEDEHHRPVTAAEAAGEGL